MPIYAYKCSTCGHAEDVLQKMSDAPLTVCPACGKPTYVKQVTAAGFQLKGSGWYVTDFRGGDSSKAKPAASGGGAASSTSGESGASSSGAESTSTSSISSSDSASSAPSTPASAPSSSS